MPELLDGAALIGVPDELYPVYCIVQKAPSGRDSAKVNMLAS